MFAKFKYERIPLSLIRLDDRNPRIVTATKLKTEQEIVRYFFEHEGLGAFLKKISLEGRNQGAERPYVVKMGKEYVVIEGNTRIAAYKLLTEQMSPPEGFLEAVPSISTPVKEDLLSVDCTIATSRDALLPIMANAHFGLGDKAKWGYLGSRKAVFDECEAGKSIAQLASAFDRKPGQIRDLILEYQLYLDTLKLDWTPAEKAALQDPAVEFNPPVRFLQSSGHKTAMGLDFDRPNLSVVYETSESKKKLKHLVKKLVVNAEKGLGATASYADVFVDYFPAQHGEADMGQSPQEGGNQKDAAENKENQKAGDIQKDTQKHANLKKGTLFSYTPTNNNLLFAQLMKEAKGLNTENFPAAGAGLLRSIIEAILKYIIEDQGANSLNKLLSLETALDLCLSNAVQISLDDRKILKEFKKSHLDYVNLGAHASVVPNYHRLMAARDCVDQFVLRNI